MIGVGFVYFLVIIGYLASLPKGDSAFLLFSLAFIGVTYFSIISKFNKELKTYIDFIEKKILA